MEKTEYGLGGRLPLVDPKSLTAEQQKYFDLVNGHFVPWADKAGFQSKDDAGNLIGPFNPMLYSPEIGTSFMKLQQTEQDHTSLPKRVREVIILTVGSVWKAPYELYAHKHVGMKAGLTNEQVEALAAGRAEESLGADEKTAQAFTLELVATKSLSQDVYTLAYKAFGHRGIMDMIVLIGLYETVCTLLTAIAVPVPVDGKKH